MMAYYIKDLYMLLPYLKNLNNKKVILGSQSKSRKELLQTQRIQYKSIPSAFAEDLDKESFKSPSDYNLQTCKGKVTQLLSRFQNEKIEWDLLICGDTIAEYQGKIIQKPQNEQHCIQMVQELSGHTHRIYTANIIVFNVSPIIRYEWVSRAQVTFGSIAPQIVKQFAKQPEPYLHSGGYEVSAISGSFITRIEGNYHAVQGLDIHEICQKIIEGGKKLEWF